MKKKNTTKVWTFELHRVYENDYEDGKWIVYANGVKSYENSDIETAPDVMKAYFELWDTDEVIID